MERDEIQGLVDGVMAVLATGKTGTHVELHVEADEVEPLATAISDVLECQPMLPAVVRQDGDGDDADGAGGGDHREAPNRGEVGEVVQDRGDHREGVDEEVEREVAA